MTKLVQVTSILLLALGSVAVYAAVAWRSAHLATPAELQGIPARLERIPLRSTDPAFVGTRDTLEPRIVKLSEADHYLAVDYRGAEGAYVRLHIGVNVDPNGWLHEPSVCLPSQGWTTTSTARVPLWADLDGVTTPESIWRMRLTKGNEHLLVYYWFQWGEHIVTTRFERAWQRFRTLLAGERDHPLQIVILYSPVDASEEVSATRIESLVRAIWPDLYLVLSSGD